MSLSRKNTKVPYISFLLLLVFFTACSPSSQTSQILSDLKLDGIYSTRSQTQESVVTILKLKSPALLAKAERKEGKLVIDKKLEEAILKEQAETIQALQNVSSQIRILIRYKLVLNGIAIWAPAEVLEDLQSLPNVTAVERAGKFDRPVLPTADDDEEEEETRTVAVVGDNTSVKFIGAEEAYKQGLRGKGMKVGIIDSGVDYTHKMLGGEGTVEAYNAVDPGVKSASFPNKKVVAGIDLVGTKYNSGAVNHEDRVPVPDENPIDESGHGTHVAGTVAGNGDNVSSYDGVAPEADLYAIKVFGKSGSTSDEVVIAALEYAINPSGDGKFEDQLDIVNLSLGGDYGSSHSMYAHAIRNTVLGGTIVVAASGNSGDKAYVTSSPAVNDETISVASSIDNMKTNLEFPTVLLTFANGETLSAEFSEGDKSIKVEKLPALEGEVVAVGLLKEDLAPELAATVKGKVALADRGESTFADKVERAIKAGAIGVIVANNNDEEPMGMSLNKKVEIPVVMITKKAGAKAKEQLKNGKVVINFKSSIVAEKPWLADSISTSSSRGPRSDDGFIKPEITAPGTKIVSAGYKMGDKGVYMSGTSMATPHVAGVMVLLKQKFPTLTPFELKSVLMGHAKPIADKEKKQYTISRQGAGRVQIGESLKATVVSVPASLSFGVTDVEKQKTLTQTITLKNLTDKAVTLTPEWTGSAALKFSAPSVSLAAGEKRDVTVSVRIVSHEMTSPSEELDGFLKFSTESGVALKLPALAIVRKISQLTATATVQATSALDGAGAAAEITLENKGSNAGAGYLFNLLGTDGRKKGNKMDQLSDRNCDLQSAGYRIVESKGKRVLQIAAKLYEGVSTWHRCEVNVQIDSDGDGKADQEIAGTQLQNLAGLAGEQFVSLLLDANIARELRAEYDKTLKRQLEEAAKEKDPKKQKITAKLDFSQSALAASPMTLFNGATLAIIEAEVANLALSDNGDLKVKISTTHSNYGTIETDDYLGNQDKEWASVSTTDLGQAYSGLPLEVVLEGLESKTFSVKKGYSTGDLILYAPYNRGVIDTSIEDTQSIVVPVTYNQGK